MKIIFNIIYRTNWGESVYITGAPAALGEWDKSKAVKLKLDGNDHWSATIDVSASDKDFGYRYFVRNDNGTIRDEWGHGDHFTASAEGTYRIYDRWQDQPFDKPLYSSLFTECVCRQKITDGIIMPTRGFVTLSVSAPMVNGDRVLAVSGNNDALGNWDEKRVLKLSNSSFPIWKVNIPAEQLNPATEYKFLVLDRKSDAVVAWEGGENRRIGVSVNPSDATVLSGMRFINTLQPWRGAGTAIPVFSLRSKEDMGVGDFYDLLGMIDWAANTHQSILQLLPINDTTMTGTWTDSYPYNANSTFALHPMYLRVTELGEIADPKRREYYKAVSAKLNALATVDYEGANKLKTEYIKEIFAQEGAKTLASSDYKAFVKQNSRWLMQYATFCTLRDRFGTPDFTQWGEYAKYSEKVLKKVLTTDAKQIDLVCYVQYHLDRQMRHVHEYAASKGVALKGDVPIGISRTSADAWTDTRLFNMDCQAGAPPDDFSVMGQNWGFPTYNWEEMNKDGFAWWKDRFRKMAEYFDAYRIDHVLGFFRIWQIPMDAIHGLLGYFYPALPFTAEELRNNYDFWINPEVHTKPYIMDYFLSDFFGPYTSEVAEKYLVKGKDGRYMLKKEYSTQRKISNYFADQPKDEKNTRICNGLLGLADEVLFIEDPAEKGKYHPRISAQFTYVYRSLNDYERWCFNRLYNDFFYRRHNDFWYGKAMWKMPPLIDATDMLCCAEDLGMIPACVPAVMEQLEILSLEIQRMPKDPNEKFADPRRYPYYSVCTTSTHDMGGIRQWWEEDRDATQRFYNDVLHESGAAPQYAEPWICDRIVDQHLYSPSMLCILPLQDWLAIDGSIRREDPREEQINVPSIARHYWRYRMHLTIEDLIAHADFNSYVREKIDRSGR